MDEPRISRFDVPTVAAVMQIPKVEHEAAECVVKLMLKHQRCEDVTHEETLAECDKLLGTCGVESLEIEGARHYTDEGIRMCSPFSYCNAGDPYVMTLARDHAEGRWVIACWGDLAEEYEREHKLGDYEEFEEAPERCPSCHGTSFRLESFPTGHWGDQGLLLFVETGTGYYFECQKCGHHCRTPENWTPPASEDDEEDEG